MCFSIEKSLFGVFQGRIKSSTSTRERYVRGYSVTALQAQNENGSAQHY